MAFRGVVITGPAEMREVLRTINLTYNLYVQEDNSKLYFKDADNADEITVAEDDLAAHTSDGDLSRKMTITDTSGQHLPKEVEIEFIDVDKEYQTGSQRERRVMALANRSQNLRIPLSLNKDEAREIALRELWKAWATRLRLYVALPPSYLHVLENDLLNLTVDGEAYKMRVLRAEFGLNGVIQIEGDIEEVETYVYTPSGASSPYTHPVVTYPSALLFILLDIPPLLTEHAEQCGLYVMACLWDEDAKWRGGEFYYSKDDVTYSEMVRAESEAILGFAKTELGGATGYFWDRINTVDVEIFEGTLSSATELEVLNGANRAIIGDEIIAFQTATNTGHGTYTLSKLMRGLRNTEEFISEHAIGDFFALLKPGSGLVMGEGIKFLPINKTTIGNTIYYKAISPGDDLDNVTKQSFVFEGNSVKAFSVYNIQGIRDGSSNLTITWIRRTREVRSLFTHSTPGTPGWAFSLQAYEIDIYDNGNVVRTISISTRYPGWIVDGIYVTSVIYTAAQQTTDGLTPGDPVHLKMFQMSEAGVGRGREADITI